jgi:hypothetical protein
MIPIFRIIVMTLLFYGSAYALSTDDIKKKADEYGGVSLSIRECTLVGSKFSNYDDNGVPHPDKGFHCAYVSDVYRENLANKEKEKEKEKLAKQAAIAAKEKAAEEQRENKIKKRKIEEARKAEEFERKAKIKTGKQYICSDGHDSYVLKYNGNSVIFGDVPMVYMFYAGGYSDTDYLRLVIDRTEGTIAFDGNAATCKER